MKRRENRQIPGKRACTLFAFGALLALCIGPASISAAQTRITSKHKARVKLRGIEGAFIRVGASRPLAIQVTGPGTLALSLRKELESGARGPTLVRLQRDGRPVGKLRLGSRDPVRTQNGKGQAGAAQTRRVSIPGGSHRFVIRVIGRGHAALVNVSFEPEIGEIPELVALSEPPSEPSDPTSLDLMDLVPLEEPSASDDAADALEFIPLVELEPETPASDAADAAETEIVSLDLIDIDPVDIDPVDATFGARRPLSGGLIGAPLEPGPGLGAQDTRPGRLLLGLRGVAARVGFGSSAVGGGIDLLYRPGLVDGKVLVGLSIDYLPQQLYRDVIYPGGVTRRIEASLSSLPILLTGTYQHGRGRLSLWGTAGVGFSLVGVGRGDLKNSALHPAGALAVGPALRLGPGHLTASLRLAASTGAVKSKGGSDTSAALSASTISSTGLTLGYAISL